MSAEPTNSSVDEAAPIDVGDGQLVVGASPEPMLAEEPAPEPADQTKSVAEEPAPIVAALVTGTADAESTLAEVEPSAEAVEMAAQDQAPPVAAKPKPKSRSKPKLKEAAAAAEPKVVSDKMVWFVLKVQSNREDSIRDAILRRLKIAALENYVGDVVVPTEKVMEIKDGKKRVVKRKFYPGYIIIQMEMNDDVWFTIRDTPGVGHFVGSGDKPVPMADHEVAKMLGHQQEAAKIEQPKAKIPFAKGDRVTINEGPFENFEGDVEEINEDKGLVRVMIQIFGRPTPVDVEYWLASLVRN